MIVEGAFFRVLFPTSEKPRQPGLPHIGYCLAVLPPLVLVAYTSSVPWPPGAPLPAGSRLFTRDESAALNQRRAFRLVLSRQARLPLSKRWIPDIDEPNQGVIAIAPARLRQELYEMTLDLEKRYRSSVERFGV